MLANIFHILDYYSFVIITGMYPDIWHNLQGLMNFTYQITFPPDMGWGTFKNGKWNGMIRQLVDDEIDIAPAEFTITQSRSQGVDFLVIFKVAQFIRSFL